MAGPSIPGERDPAQLLLAAAQQATRFDLTPMIDCVFLLMIFFMLVIDVSQQNLEDLVLPRAVYQQPDDRASDRRPVINVLQSGAVYYLGRRQYDPATDGADASGIERMLRLIRQTIPLRTVVETEGGVRRESFPDPLLLRADKWTDWQHIAAVMTRCNAFGFRRVELALSGEDKEARAGDDRQPGRTRGR